MARKTAVTVGLVAFAFRPATIVALGVQARGKAHSQEQQQSQGQGSEEQRITQKSQHKSANRELYTQVRHKRHDLKTTIFDLSITLQMSRLQACLHGSTGPSPAPAGHGSHRRHPHVNGLDAARAVPGVCGDDGGGEVALGVKRDLQEWTPGVPARRRSG